MDGAELSNSGTVTVNNQLLFANGAKIANSSGTVAGGENGRILLDSPSNAPPEDPRVSVTDLIFYQNSDKPTDDYDGEFKCESGKWIRTAYIVTVTVENPEYGGVTNVGSNTVFGLKDLVLTITPNSGYMVSEVPVILDEGMPENWSWNLINAGSGAFEFPLENIQSDFSITVVFVQADIAGLLQNSFAILEENSNDAGSIAAALAEEFACYGYTINTGDISVSGISVDGLIDAGYGTFDFTVSGSEPETGYIVPQATDILFKLDGIHDETPVNEICIAHLSDWVAGEFGVPAMDSGTMNIFGAGGVIAMPFSTAVDSAFGDYNAVEKPFYFVEYHIVSSHVNWFGFKVIQDDALCVKVSPGSKEGEQKTLQWEVGKYAVLNDGAYSSNIFFGNDSFTLSLPKAGIGGAVELTVAAASSPGYAVEDKGDGTYAVEFFSDYYDSIALDLTFDETEQRTLNINRVGVEIGDYRSNGEQNVFHGTQSSTSIDYSEHDYQIFATYCIPDGGFLPPYGLSVIFTWADGSTTLRTITDPCKNPHPMAMELYTANGVFHYDNHADCCDYLLYAGTEAEAPVKINVTVLKGDPTAASFGGVFFGSGAGITWEPAG